VKCQQERAAAVLVLVQISVVGCCCAAVMAQLQQRLEALHLPQHHSLPTRLTGGPTAMPWCSPKTAANATQQQQQQLFKNVSSEPPDLLHESGPHDALATAVLPPSQQALNLLFIKSHTSST
jgi:hypothetical protein